jgi:hypothetical protein
VEVEVLAAVISKIKDIAIVELKHAKLSAQTQVTV